MSKYLRNKFFLYQKEKNLYQWNYQNLRFLFTSLDSIYISQDMLLHYALALSYLRRYIQMSSR